MLPAPQAYLPLNEMGGRTAQPQAQPTFAPSTPAPAALRIFTALWNLLKLPAAVALIVMTAIVLHNVLVVRNQGGPELLDVDTQQSMINRIHQLLQNHTTDSCECTTDAAQSVLDGACACTADEADTVLGALAVVSNYTNPALTCASANLDRRTVLRDALRHIESGRSFPADPIVAVGDDTDGGRIITMVNSALAIFRKNTYERIFFQSINTVFGWSGLDTGDPYVVWDRHARRFFALAHEVTFCASGVTVDSPSAIAGTKCSTGARFGPQNYTLASTAVVAASPLDGCSTIAGTVSGNIALIVRGTCTFAIKVKNAQNAGALGVIVYNNVAGAGPITMSGGDPSITIPSRMIGNGDGLALAANLPGATASITSTAQISASTKIFLAVSTTAAPNNASDFLVYAVANAVHNVTLADYPKMSVDANAVYITTNDIGEVGPNPAQLLFTGVDFLALNKTALIAGTGVVPLWQHVLTKEIFGFPAEQRTPLADRQQPMFFVSQKDNQFVSLNVSTSTALRIWTGTSGGLNLQPIDVPYPTPMTFGRPLPGGGFTPTIRQPPPAVIGLVSLIGTVTTAVAFQDRLYVALSHNVSAVQTVVRWFELDVSRVVSHRQITLVQWADINPGPQYDTFFPHLDVDRDGNLGIGFSMSGPTRPVVAAYTGRLRSDAYNTTRYPVQIALDNEHTYWNGATSNRWGDYTGMVVDPVDGKTFYGFNMMPDPLGSFLGLNALGPCNRTTSTCIASSWTTGLFTFQINAATACLPARTPTYSATQVVASAADYVAAALDVGEFDEELYEGQVDPDRTECDGGGDPDEPCVLTE